MRPNGVYVATFDSTAFSTAIGVIEIQAADETIIEIIRAWVGPAEGASPLDEIQTINMYRNDAAGSGTSMTEQEVQGEGDNASTATAISEVTVGATPEDLWFDAYHTQNGWLYLPVPEERIRINGGTGQDNFGIRFPVAPAASMNISAGVLWHEFS